jgi:hypothetical protein
MIRFRSQRVRFAFEGGLRCPSRAALPVPLQLGQQHLFEIPRVWRGVGLLSARAQWAAIGGSFELGSGEWSRLCKNAALGVIRVVGFPCHFAGDLDEALR